MEHQPLLECIKAHSDYENAIKYQNEMLVDMKQDLKDIKQELKSQSDRIWLLYTKVVIIACLSGGGSAGLLKWIVG